MDEFDAKLLLLGGLTGELEVVWALVELAALQDDPLPLAFADADAVDAVSFETLEDGELAYVLDDCLQYPMTYSTLRRLILGHGSIDNPFTRSRISRVISVRIMHEA
jgi:hypothetical protein